MSNMRAMAGANGNLANFALQTILIDLSVNRSIQGQQFPVSGDWLYLDESSAGPLRTELSGTFDRSNSFLLVPGKPVVVKGFRQVTVFNDQVSAIVNLRGVSFGEQAVPLARLMYGYGDCPFQASHSAERQSGVELVAFATAQNFVQSSSFYRVTEGQILDIYSNNIQTAGAGNSSILRASVLFTNAGGTAVSGGIFPDTQERFDVAAGVGVARTRSSFRRIVVPRDAAELRCICDNSGTEAANNVSLGGFSVFAR